MTATGETWNCPHCGELILRSAANCPACQRRLRFETVTRPRSAGATGETWNCPHCGELILRSAASCPACQRRLRFETVTRPRSAQGSVCPLSVDGVIRHPGSEGAWEYSVLVEVHDPKGEKLARRVVAVGAIPPGETRIFTLRVELDVAEKFNPATVPSSESAGDSAIPEASPLPAADDRHA